MNVTITIDKEKVLGIVEGLSTTIAQHNGGVPSFEQLWASESERRKLDIWWRDAVNDLEDTLKKWVLETSAGYDLSATAGDYTLRLDPGDYWSQKLTGLLTNRVQYYFVHAVMAGWLSDFAEVNAPNYTELTANDLKGILNVMNFRELAFEGEERREDPEEKDASGGLPTGEGERERDTEGKAATESQHTGQERREDDEGKKDGAGGGGDAAERREDSEEKDASGRLPSGEERRKDSEEKAAAGSQHTGLVERERDDPKPYRVGRDLIREGMSGLFFEQ